MTFIASVIAKKGVALIADSMVTHQMPILEYDRFISYLQHQPKNAAGEASINTADIQNLFELQPAFTKDYEEKLFRVNKFIGMTTTGIAYINNKNISDIMEGFRGYQMDIEIDTVPFIERLNQFSAYLNIQIKEHLHNRPVIGFCSFIATHYDPAAHKTTIYKVIINEASAQSLADVNYNFVTLTQEEDWAKVVCDGQNKISENVLYGSGKTFFKNFPLIVQDILQRLNLPPGTVPANFINDLIADPFYSPMFYGDIEITNLSDLSVQQAVDLASLLMRLEVDFQKYTKTMPTVGGLIKLAVIDENGFRFILGHEIEPPKHIHL